VIKQILHKVFSISLAFIVLFSTVSFTIEKHFCGNTLVDVSLFAEADKCKMESFDIKLEKITKKTCCKDTVDLIEGQDQLNITSNDSFKFINKIVVTTFVFTYLNLYEELPNNIIPHKDYSPPNLVFDRQVLDQVFLI